MITPCTIQQTAQNRHCEKLKISYQLICTKINPNDYENLIQWITYVNNLLRAIFDPFFIPFFNNLGLRTVPAQSHNQIPGPRLLRPNDSPLLGYLCPKISQAITKLSLCFDQGISALIQFNQNISVSELITPSYLYAKAELQFIKCQYQKLELNILNSIQFKCAFTFPHDYIDSFTARFPWFPKLPKAIITLIGFPLVFPQTCEYSAEEIFFGVVLAIFQSKKVVLNQIQQRVLLALTDCWQNAHKISQATLAAMQRYSVEQPTD